MRSGRSGRRCVNVVCLTGTGETSAAEIPPANTKVLLQQNRWTKHLTCVGVNAAGLSLHDAKFYNSPDGQNKTFQATNTGASQCQDVTTSWLVIVGIGLYLLDYVHLLWTQVSVYRRNALHAVLTNNARYKRIGNNPRRCLKKHIFDLNKKMKTYSSSFFSRFSK